MSLLPPGETVTMALMGLVGKSAAQARPPPSPRAMRRTVAVRSMMRFTATPPCAGHPRGVQPRRAEVRDGSLPGLPSPLLGPGGHGLAIRCARPRLGRPTHARRRLALTGRTHRVAGEEPG